MTELAPQGEKNKNARHVTNNTDLSTFHTSHRDKGVGWFRCYGYRGRFCWRLAGEDKDSDLYSSLRVMSQKVIIEELRGSSFLSRIRHELQNELSLT